MKYAHLVMGLLIGTALGGSVVAATGVKAPVSSGTNAAAPDAEAIKAIVRQTILDEPKLIMESVQKYQVAQRNQESQGANEALKDPAIHDQIYNFKDAGSVGPKDSKKVIVEFFDYNCPACKMQYKAIVELLAKDKSVRVIFRELPIFGPVSDTNSRLALAVVRLAPEKYFEFYQKMMSHQGHAEEKDTLGYIKDLGLDPAKVKAESLKPEVEQGLTASSKLGEALHIQGTPTLIVGNELIPHAAGPDELLAKVNAAAK